MKRLTIQRHAKSAWDHAGVSDHARPLNDRGRRSASAMSKWAESSLPTPDLLLCSTAVRTRETAAYIQEAFQLPATAMRYEETLYLADPKTLWLTALTALEDANHVWVIAHNPGLTFLHNALGDVLIDNLVTGAAAHFVWEGKAPSLGSAHRARYEEPRNFTD